eukprot:TRINITY_DN532_c0_g1_i6.p1 TRINITY_DN532_c0_g1~~TRINITY_DN532_c0_g1_i6.p1  ORF type:complete len:248 (-),score=68.91 TRINITY_DN532_c0_g1_i6:66-809(-)
MRSAVIILFLAAAASAQYQQRHYGYRNPYQYHPYMRYHGNPHEQMHPEPVKEEPAHPIMEHHPEPQAAAYHQARHYQPRHYGGGAYAHHYQQQPSSQERSYAGRHTPRHHHRRPSGNALRQKPMKEEPKPQKEEEHKAGGEPVYLGTFKNPTHEVKGDIFMLDDHTLYIQGFSFDGQAPDVYFWSDGVPIPYYTRTDNHVTMNVQEYADEDIVLTLPPEKPTLEKMRKFQVWCKQYGINFGEFSIDN